MTSPLFDQSTKFISSECQEWFLERSLLSGERRAAQEWDWQARCLEGQHRSGYLESLEMLSWRYQMGWSRKASNTQSREIHENSSDIQMIFSHARKRSKDEANQPQQESALDHKWFSNSYGWSMVFILVFIVFTKLINWTSYCYLESEIEI